MTSVIFLATLGYDGIIANRNPKRKYVTNLLPDNKIVTEFLFETVGDSDVSPP